MDEKDYEKHKETIEKYIEKNIISSPNILDFSIHRLPTYVKEDSNIFLKLNLI